MIHIEPFTNLDFSPETKCEECGKDLVDLERPDYYDILEINGFMAIHKKCVSALIKRLEEESKK